MLQSGALSRFILSGKFNLNRHLTDFSFLPLQSQIDDSDEIAVTMSTPMTMAVLADNHSFRFLKSSFMITEEQSNIATTFGTEEVYRTNHVKASSLREPL